MKAKREPTQKLGIKERALMLANDVRFARISSHPLIARECKLQYRLRGGVVDLLPKRRLG
jgi:hypothetical protein